MIYRLWIWVLLPAIAAILVIGCDSDYSSPPSEPGLSQPNPPQPLVVTPSPTPSAQPQAKLAAPDAPDSQSNAQVSQMLETMANKGYNKSSQGIWLQTEDTLLANHQGTVPLPAASLTKVATTLAVLDILGPKHQFITEIGYTGTLQNGVIQGDLVITGGQDPFFVWEDAIALGNALTDLGIKQVMGNLIIVGSFYMNYEEDPAIAGDLLRQGLNVQLWPDSAYVEYENLPENTPQPEVKTTGLVKTVKTAPTGVKPLWRYSSLPVAQLLKKMNQYSNNPMAEMFANIVGGAPVVVQKAVSLTGVPASEIKLVNGSGLGEENQLSPRAAIALFLAIQRLLEPQGLTLGDVMSIMGEKEGILVSRPLPKFTVLKSGSLYAVSTLAGALPTQEKGIVWFAILNGGSYYEELRVEQEAFLKQWVNQWGAVSSLPTELTPKLSPPSGSRIERLANR